MFRWYKFLVGMGYPRFQSIFHAYYNNKHWYPEGEWPYNMRKKNK